MTGVPEPGPADGSRDALDAVVSTAVELARRVRERPRRIGVRHGDTSIEVEWDTEPALAPATPLAGDHPPPAGADLDGDGRQYVRAPMVGTFYRSPEPGAKPYVEVGDLVEADQQVCIVEAMKLMNAVHADVAGRVVEILVPDAAPVEYEQPLIAVVPAGPGEEG